MASKTKIEKKTVEEKAANLSSFGDRTAPQPVKEALVTSDSLLHSIIDQSPYPMWVADHQGTLIWLNQACREMLHITAAEVVGKYNVFRDNIVEQQGHFPLLQRVFQKGKSARFELTYDTSLLKNLPLKSAVSVILDVTVSPIKDAQGQITNVIFQHVDVTERRRAEEALRQSEKKYRTLYHEFQGILNTLPDTLCLISPDFKIVWGNEASAITTPKHSLAETFGQQCYALRLNRSAPCENCPVERSFRSGKLETEEIIVHGENWELRAVPVYDDQGELLGAVELARNITQRKRMEKALEDEKLFTETLLDSLPGTFFLLDSQGKHLRSNTSVLAATGYSAKELTQMSALDFIADEDKPAAQRALGEIFAKGKATLEARQLAKDGRKTPFLFSAKKFIIDDKPYILGTGVDISARKEAEDALRDSEKRLKEAQEMAHLGFWHWNVKTGDVTWSEEVYKIFQLDPKEFTPHIDSILKLSPWPGDQERGRELMRKAMESHEKGAYEQRFLRPDKSIGHYYSTFQGKYDAEGNLVFIVGTVLDITERKQMEESLARTQFGVDRARDAIHWVTPDGKLAYVNQTFCDSLGYSREELLSMSIFDIDPQVSKAHWPERWRQSRELGSHMFESRHKTKDGRTIPVEVAINFINFGGEEYHCAFARDISERKQAEEALRESEARFRQVVESSPLPIGIGNDTGKIEYVNPQFVETFGYSLEDLPRLDDWFRLAYPDPAYRELFFSKWLQHWERIKQDGVAEVTEAEIPCRDGSQRIMQIFGTLMGNKSLVVFNDLTERKRAEIALRNSERRLTEIIDFLPDATFAIDLTGKVIAWNRAIEEMSGVKAESMVGKGDYEYALPFYGMRRPLMIDLVFKSDAEIEKNYSFLKREGDVLLAEAHVPVKGEMRLLWGKARPLYDSEGKVVGAIEAIRDISERQRAEEERAKLEAQMREVQKLESLGVLAGGIAHDFNNLLMVILGNADLALLALSNASPARPYVKEISQGSLRAAELCRQMLAYSGKARFVTGRYNLSEIVREMAQMLKVSVSKKASLRYSFAEDLPAVEVDVTQVRQIIMNLIINASEALADKNGFISVATDVMYCDRNYLADSYPDDNLPEGRYVYLEVADTGSGMDDETRRRVFDPFFTTKFTGRGLGLAAVLGIVRGHQGAIKVYSEPGQGTTFKVLLPAVEWAPGDRAAPVVCASQKLPGGTILLVDDDPHIRLVGSQILERLGFKVETAAHGREGLRVFKVHRGRIDCVILDLTMPEMAGDEVFRELRRLQKDIRVILSSGFNEEEVSQRFAGKGASGFIQKPYSVGMLQEVLNRVLGPK